MKLSKYIYSFTQSTPVLILIAVTLICFEFSIPELFKLFNSAYNGKNLPSMLFLMAATSVFFFIIPIIWSKFVYRETVQSLGLAWPTNYWETFFLTLLALLIMIPIIVVLAKQGPFQIYYSLNKPGTMKLVIVSLIIFPVLYFFEEFFFRGFALMALWKKIGWHSIWVTDILFTLAHLAKPPVEVLVALPAGIILAYLTLRTKSIYPAVFVHYILGITMIFVTNGVV